MANLLTKLAGLLTGVAMRHVRDDEAAREAVVRRYPEPGDADSVDAAARITALEGALRSVTTALEALDHGPRMGCEWHDGERCVLCVQVAQAKQVLGDK